MINIIKKQNLVEVVRSLPSGDTESYKCSYSDISVSLLRGADADIVSFTGKNLQQRVAIEDVTIQDLDGVPVQATVDNWDELTDDLIKSTGGVGGEYMFYTEADFEAAKDKIPVGANVVKMYEYPDNGYFLDRPDLWPVGTEIDFGGGLCGQRFTGTIANAVAGVLTAVPLIYFPDNNFALINSGGQWQVLNEYAQFEPFGFNINSSDQWAYVWISIGDKAIEFRSKTASVRTNRAYDIWITYKK